MMKAFNIEIAGRIIRAVVTTNHDFMAQWIHAVHSEIKHPRILGLHLSFATADRVATLQLCFDHYCLIYHMHMDNRNHFPASLRRFLLDHNNIFVGFANESKIDIAQAQLQGVVHYIALGLLAADVYNRPCLIDADLTELAALVLRMHVRSPTVPKRWDDRTLSPDQVRHATISAYVSLEIALFLFFARAIKQQGAMAQVEEDRGKVENLHILHENIRVTLTSSQAVIQEWIAEHRQEAVSYVGFDAELVVVDNQSIIGIVEFCIGRHCLVIQVQRMRTLRYLPGLESFLLRDNNIFAGVDDVERKMRMFVNVLRVGDRGVVRGVDVRRFAAAAPELREAGHRELAAEVLGRDLEMPEMVEDDWDRQFRLSDEQMETACIHALVPFQVANRLSPL